MSTATDNVTTRPSSLASDGTDGGSGPSTDQAVEPVMSHSPPPGPISRKSTLFKRFRSLRTPSMEEVAFDSHGPLGLNTLFVPSDPKIEYVFVHGLGGGSTKTWCLETDPWFFWPKEWLRHHPAFRHVRIHSFGYDADYKRAGPSFLGIKDFALGLLSALMNSECFLRNPIVFVCHSMGGLVAQKAYILARESEAPKRDLALRMSALVLLGTPHRGSDYIPWLKNLLALRPTEGAPPYVENLYPASATLTEIGVLFQRYCQDLMVYSFYESRPMAVGMSAVVESSSAVLGVPGEMAAPLNGDHRRICKFSSPEDANYRALIEAFGAINRDLLGRILIRDNERDRKELRLIQEYLGMPETPEDDLRDTEDIKIENSCDWFTSRPEFQEWLDGTTTSCSRIFWLYAKPGTGKSILAGHVATMLGGLNGDCSFYFFRHGDTTQATLSGCLLSIMWQMAQRNVVVRESLLEMQTQGVRFDRDNSKTIWRRLFEPVLLNPALIHRQFWIIDALDECSNVHSLFFVFSKLAKQLPVNLFVTSRRTDEILSGFRGLARVSTIESILSTEIQVEDTRHAIARYLEDNRHKIHVSDPFRLEVLVQRILCDAQGCFLWVRLLLDELSEVWTTNQVEQAIEEGIPQGMDLLYARCIQRIESKTQATIDIARSILTWVVCAVRPLTVNELVGALETELGENLEDPHEAVPSICAQLVHVDASDRVLIVHLTAKTFLQSAWNHSSLAVAPADGHGKLLKACLRLLVADAIKPPTTLKDCLAGRNTASWPDFLAYAAINLKEHLERAHNAPQFSRLLYEFFHRNVFTWIEFVATKKRLEALTSTALAIRDSVLRHVSGLPGEKVEFLHSWIVDIHRLVSLFGPDLLRQPASVHFIIPPLCPRGSAIRSIYAKKPTGLKVLGETGYGWGDEVACIDSEDGQTQAYAVAAGARYFAVSFGKTVVLYYASTCQEWKRLEHNHDVFCLLFNHSDTVLCSAGSRELNVWDVEEDSPMHTILLDSTALWLWYSAKRSAVYAALQDHSVLRCVLPAGDLVRHSMRDATFPPCQSVRHFTVLSPDVTRIALSCRDRCVKIFDVDSGLSVGLLMVDNRGPATFRSENASFATCAVFNQDERTPLIAVGYGDGTIGIFDYRDMHLVKATTIDSVISHAVCVIKNMDCSPDGKLLVVGAIRQGIVGSSIVLFGFQTLQALFIIPENAGPVRQLSFSGDSTRILEVRQTRCTIWEHNVSLSGTEGYMASQALRTAAQSQVETKAVTVDQAGDFFFSGRRDGTIWYHETDSGRCPQLLVNHKSSIRHLLWGKKKSLLIVSTADCPTPKIYVHRFYRSSGVFRVSRPIFVLSSKVFAPWSLLLNASENMLLCGGPQVSLWNLESRKAVFHCKNPLANYSKWTTNPVNSTERVLWTTKEVTIWDWLASQSEEPLTKLPISIPGNPVLMAVVSVFDNKKVILALTANFAQRENVHAALQHYLLDIGPLAAKAGTLTPSQAFKPIGSRIWSVVGSYGSRLVFLDERSHVCSAELLHRDGKEGFRHTTHFRIPSSWREDLRWFPWSILTPKGDILVRARSDVVIIKNGLAFEDEVWEVFDD